MANPVVVLEMRRCLYQQNGPLPLVAALSLARNLHVQDERDKVFALLSFTSPIHYNAEEESASDASSQPKLFPVIPDYTQQLARLYLSVARALLEKNGIIVLSLVRHYPGVGVSKLPSWIPDLTTNLIGKPLGIQTNALDLGNIPSNGNSIYTVNHGNRETGTYNVLPDGSLRTRALVWDIVEDTGNPNSTVLGADLKGLIEWVRLLEKTRIARQTRADTLWRTMLCNETSTKYPAPNLRQGFISWMKLAAFTQLVDIHTILDNHVNDFNTTRKPLKPRYCPHEAKVLLPKLFEAVHALDGVTSAFAFKEENRWIDMFCSSEPEDRDYDGLVKSLSHDARAFGVSLQQKDHRRKLFLTRGGYLGAGPTFIFPNDRVCFIPGSNVPYVLRPQGRGTDKYRLFGEAYVHGIMDGELFSDKDEKLWKEIQLV